MEKEGFEKEVFVKRLLSFLDGRRNKFSKVVDEKNLVASFRNKSENTRYEDSDISRKWQEGRAAATGSGDQMLLSHAEILRDLQRFDQHKEKKKNL